MTAAVKTLSSSPMTVKVFGVTPNRASGCMSCMTRCLTRCCMRLLNIYLLYHTLYLEKRGCRDHLRHGWVMLRSCGVPHVPVCSHGNAPNVGSPAHPRACRQERSDQLRWWHVHPAHYSPQT